MPEIPHDVSALAHMERLLAEQDRRMDLQFEAMERALILAREQAEKQYGHLNALRNEVMTDRSRFVETSVCAITRENFDKRISQLEKRIATWGGAILVLIFVLQVIGPRIWSHFAP